MMINFRVQIFRTVMMNICKLCKGYLVEGKKEH